MLSDKLSRMAEIFSEAIHAAENGHGVVLMSLSTAKNFVHMMDFAVRDARELEAAQVGASARLVVADLPAGVVSLAAHRRQSQAETAARDVPNGAA